MIHKTEIMPTKNQKSKSNAFLCFIDHKTRRKNFVKIHFLVREKLKA